MARENLVLDDAARAERGGSYATLGDGVTHYRIEGPELERPLVLLHGGTVPAWCFDELAEAMVARGRRVLRYDQYGRGWSDRPDIDYTPALYQRQLDELLAHLRITGPIDLLGFSWGGAVAVRYTRLHPERVHRLMFVAPVVHYRAKAVQIALARSGLIGSFFMATVGIRTIISRAAELIGEHPKREQWMADFAAQTRYKGFQRSLRTWLLQSLQEDYLPDYQAVAQVRPAVLLVWGDEDSEIPAEHVAALRDAFSEIRYVELAGLGHGVFSTASAELADHVHNFCAAES